MQTLFKNKGIIIGIAVLVVILIGYFVYKGSHSSSTSSGGVTRQAVSQTTSVGGIAPGPGQEFVSQLLAIHNINLNLDLFTDPVFIGLQDFSRAIPDQPKYRPNPFAPINASELNGSADNSQTVGVNASAQTGVTTVKKTPTRTSGAAAGTSGSIFEAVPSTTTKSTVIKK
jgi:hypothetical protein